MRADIRDIGALRAAADQIEQQFGKIDIVVADAAIQRWKPLLDMDDADWRDVIDNNLNGTANTIRAFAPKMVARNKGRIIVLSSMQGKHGTKDAASYSASKWGILGLMKSAALEFGQYNITVNAIIPGLVDTALTRYETRLRESMAENGQKPPDNPTPQQAWDSRSPTVPMKVGWLQPDDISPVAVFLASDAANLVTGAEYEVTAGDSAKDIRGARRRCGLPGPILIDNARRGAGVIACATIPFPRRTIPSALEKEDACRFSFATITSTRPSRR